MEEATGSHASTQSSAPIDSHTAKCRCGPTWRGWVLSILVAVILSVTATLLLGGFGAFRSDRAAVGAVDCGSGAGSGNCPHSTAGK